MSRAFNSNGSMPHMVNSLITHAKQDLTHYPELANLLRGTSLKLAKGLMVDGLQVPRIDGDVMLESGFLGLIDQVCAAGAERALVAALRGFRDVDASVAMRTGSLCAGLVKARLLREAKLDWMKGLSV